MWHPSSRHFFFPDFKFIKDKNDHSKRVGMDSPQFLSLDWLTQQELLFEKHGFFVRDAPADSLGCPYGDTPHILPPEYRDAVYNMVYAIPPAFKVEIERNVFRFVEERSIRRLTRNNVILLPRLWEPGVEHLWVAFYLIADCAYDLESDAYLRGPLKVVLPYLLAHRFWCGQGAGGSEILSGNARLHRLERYYEAGYKNNEMFGADINDAIQSLRGHAMYWDNWVGSKREERQALQALLRQRKYEAEKKAAERND